jgi:hypothetical protein
MACLTKQPKIYLPQLFSEIKSIQNGLPYFFSGEKMNKMAYLTIFQLKILPKRLT